MEFENIVLKPKKNKKNPYMDSTFFPNTFNQYVMVSDTFKKSSRKVKGLNALYKQLNLFVRRIDDYPAFKIEGSIVLKDTDLSITMVKRTYMKLDFILEPDEDNNYNNIKIVIKYAKDFFRDLNLKKVPFTGVPKNASYELVTKEVERNGRSWKEIMDLYKGYLGKYLKIVEKYIIENSKEGKVNG